MSFNIRDFSSPSHLNQSQNRSRIRDDAKHSNSIMMSPIHRESRLTSPQPARPSVGSPLIGRRKTNLDSSNSRFLKSNFALSKGKVFNAKHRKTKLINTGPSNKMRISQVKEKSSFIDNRSVGIDQYLQFQHSKNNSSKIVDKDLYAIRSLLTRGLRIYHSTNTLIKILPTGSSYSKGNLMNILRDKFLLSGVDADRFTDHLFYEAGNVEKLSQAAKRISSFCGFDQGMRREENTVETIIRQINCTSGQLDSFDKKIRDSISSNQILPSDIRIAAYECGIKLDTERLCDYFLGRSLSLTQINAYVFRTLFLNNILSQSVEESKNTSFEEKKSANSIKSPTVSSSIHKKKIAPKKSLIKNPIGKLNLKKPSSKKSKIFSKIHQGMEDKGNYSEETVKEAFVFLIEKFYVRKLKISQVIGPYIMDKVYDGKEYQLIKRSKLFSALEKYQLLKDDTSENILKSLFQPLVQDFIDVGRIREMFADLGISEELPPQNKHLDYSSITGPTIRIFNRMIKYMDENKIDGITKILRKSMFKNFQVEVAQTGKTQFVPTIEAERLSKLLRGIYCIDPSEDLDEEFISFLELSPEKENFIMIAKLKKALKEIKACEYFRSFGIHRRQGFPNPYDPRNSADKDPQILKMMKDLSVESLNKKGLSDSDTNIRVQLALVNWKIRKFKELRIQETVKKACQKFKDLLEAKRIREGTIPVGGDIHDTLSPSNYSMPYRKNNNLVTATISDFVSIDLDDDEKINRSMIRKKFGLVSSCNYDQMRR
ncbi:unnamed protein product [Moneuplotes crassus]|uniref:Uncharacterized protein n=1 Tax=Euplotes crassus TaxID=5936 RepID=A0AAD1XWX9_EUPCR|nr:unnamed protein product [Moneuplotes crassus]